MPETTELGRGFDDFRWSFLSIFVFTSSGENYPDTVYPAAAVSQWFRLYFAVLSGSGMFLLMSLLIAYFQRYYNSQYDSKLERNKDTALIRRRSGMLLAFSLLQALSADDFQREQDRAKRDLLRTQTSSHDEGTAEMKDTEAFPAALSQSPSGKSHQRSLSHRRRMLGSRLSRGSEANRWLNIVGVNTEYEKATSRGRVLDSTYLSFFEILGVSRAQLDALSRSERARLAIFRYDTQQFIGNLAAQSKSRRRYGCDAQFQGVVSSFLKRCSLMYATCRETGLVSYDVTQFLLHCEALASAEEPDADNPITAFFSTGGGAGGAGAAGGGMGQAAGVSTPTVQFKAQRSFTAADFERVRGQWRGGASASTADFAKESSRAEKAQAEQVARAIAASSAGVEQDRPQSAAARRFRSFQLALRYFFDNHWLIPYHSLLVLVLILNVMVIALSSTEHTSGVIPYLVLFPLFYFIELTLRVLAEDVPSDFWTFSRLRDRGNDVRYRDKALRMEIVIVVSTMLAFVITRIYVGSFIIRQDDQFRIIFLIPLLRLFSIVRTTRTIVFGLIASLPSVLPVFALLAVVEYWYAVVGVWLFAGKLSALPTSTYALADSANFDSFSLATTTLVQLMTGEGWHEIMFAAVDALNSLTPSLYFLSHHTFVLLLFTNLFIGIVCEKFHDMEDAKHAAAKLAEERKVVKDAIHVKRVYQFLEKVVKQRRLKRIMASRMSGVVS